MLEEALLLAIEYINAALGRGAEYFGIVRSNNTVSLCMRCKMFFANVFWTSTTNVKIANISSEVDSYHLAKVLTHNIYSLYIIIIQRNI